MLVLTECPECSHEITLEDIPQPLRLYVAMAALMVHAATIDTLVEHHEDYVIARGGWKDRIEGITHFVHTEAIEMQDFGEALDGEEERPSS